VLRRVVANGKGLSHAVTAIMYIVRIPIYNMCVAVRGGRGVRVDRGQTRPYIYVFK